MTKQENDGIKDVLSENLAEGDRVVGNNGQLSPKIEWVDWLPLSVNEEDFQDTCKQQTEQWENEAEK